MLPYKALSGTGRAKGFMRAQMGGQYQLIHGKVYAFSVKTVEIRKGFKHNVTFNSQNQIEKIFLCV